MDEDTLRAALAIDPDDRGAIRALEGLLAHAGRHEDVAQLLLARLERVVGSERLAIFDRVADVLEHELGTPDRALTVLLQAFAETGDDDRLGRTLGRLAERTGRWDALFEVYEARLLTPGLSDALALHRRLIGWYNTQSRRGDGARHGWRILELDPEDEGAARELETWYEDAGEWRGLVDLLRARLPRVVEPDAHKRAVQRIARLLSVRLDAAAEAIAVLGGLYLAGRDEGLRENLERLAEESDAWAALARVYEAALDDRSSAPVDVAAAHRRLAQLYARRLGDHERAVHHYDRALAVEPDDVRTLGELRGLLEAAGRHGELALVLQREAELEADRGAQYRRFVELGELYRTRIDSPSAAADAWFRALEARPDDQPVLGRLLEVYGETGQWEAAVTVLKRLVKVEPDTGRRARYELTMGMVLRDELGDAYQAVRAFDRALDLEPTLAEAMVAMEKALSAEGDPARQDRYLRKMLQRAATHRLDRSLVVQVAYALARVNREKLGNPEAALQALQVVVKHAPDDLAARMTMAQVAEEAGRSEEAARGLNALLERDATQVDAWHALYRVYRSMRRYDAAWCVSQVLTLVGQARDDEARFYRKGRTAQDGRAVGTLGAEDWRAITAPGKDEALDAVFSSVHRIAWPLMAKEPRDFKLSARRDQITLDTQTRFGQVSAYVARILGLPLDTVWATERASGMRIVQLDPAALLVGHDVEALPLDALAFDLGRSLFLLARQHVAAAVDDDAQLRRRRLTALCATALARVFPQSAPPGYDARLLEALAALSGGAVGDLERRCAGLLRATTDAFGIDGWLSAVEHTANRVGFTVCNDLAGAVARLQVEARPLGADPLTERVRALMLFSVSDAYLAMRQRLGLSLDA